MTASETPVIVTSEQERMDEFVDQLLVDPDEEVPIKSPPQNKKKTGEGSSRDVPTKPTPITQSQQAPRRACPFQELYDKLSKDMEVGPAKEICL
ncbi:hypothetical protein Hanom_Chr12g01142681 [Helianthus anomalus]